MNERESFKVGKSKDMCISVCRHTVVVYPKILSSVYVRPLVRNSSNYTELSVPGGRRAISPPPPPDFDRSGNPFSTKGVDY